MKYFMELIENRMKEYPKSKVVQSSVMKNGLTASEFWEMSSRVYAYLLEKNIGREDIVVLLLPRDYPMIVAAVGVWRAGACLTMVENTYEKERVSHIIEDSNASLVIDFALFHEMMNHEPVSGYKTVDSHDACFIVYTSGSTGKPKGVLHEYGKINLAVQALEEHALPVPEETTFVMAAPLNFLASYLILFYVLHKRRCVYVVSYDTVKNPEKISELLITEKVSETFMTPTFLKAYRKASPYLVNFFMGGESCTNTFLEGPNLLNVYASSESGMPASIYVVRESLTKSIAGKSYMNDFLLIMDENGNVLPDGNVGEICIRNLYTRGYLNLPDANEKTFKNGFCYMGDIGYKDKDGNLIFSGRKDDMIKINGNRVEPGEVEAVLRKVMGISNAVVKGFAEESRAYLCAYFISEEVKKAGYLDSEGKMQPEEIKKLLQNYLPYYMVPTYYVHLKKYPVNPNGKLMRKALEAPQTTDYANDYREPATEEEKYLCECFKKALNISKVGADDDFYLIGGDSISAMNFMADCRLRGLTIGDLYKYRTPAKLAAFFTDTFHNDTDMHYMNQKALEHDQILTPEMVTVYESNNMMPNSTMWYVPVLIKLKEETNLEKLRDSVNRVLKHHPVFSTVIFYGKDQSLRQKYVPERFKKIEIVNIDQDVWNKKISGLIEPAETIDTILYEGAIYKTQTEAYLFFNFYHAIIDGSSVSIILKEIDACYCNPEYVLQEDYYYLSVREYEKKVLRGELGTSLQYYKKLYDKTLADGNVRIELKKDYESELLTSEWFESVLSTSRPDIEGNQALVEIKGNAFFMTAALLAIAKYNKTNGAFLQWIYNGRNTAIKMNQVGLLFKTLPTAVVFHEGETLKELYTEVKQQIDYCISDPDTKLDYLYGDAVNFCLFFLYQQNIYNLAELSFAKERIELSSTGNATDASVSLDIIDEAGEPKFQCTLEHSSDMYNLDSIQQFYDFFNEIVQKMAEEKNPERRLLKDLLL